MVAPAHSCARGRLGRHDSGQHPRPSTRRATAPLVRSCCSRPAVLLVASVFTACASCGPCGATGARRQPATQGACTRSKLPEGGAPWARPAGAQQALAQHDAPACNDQYYKYQKCQQRLPPRLRTLHGHPPMSGARHPGPHAGPRRRAPQDSAASRGSARGAHPALRGLHLDVQKRGRLRCAQAAALLRRTAAWHDGHLLRACRGRAHPRVSAARPPPCAQRRAPATRALASTTATASAPPPA
jgi:hypothetical protein